jgi:hypothetical protein
MDSSLELSVGRGLVAHSDGVLGLVHEAALARVMVPISKCRQESVEKFKRA